MAGAKEDVLRREVVTCRHFEAPAIVTGRVDFGDVMIELRAGETVVTNVPLVDPKNPIQICRSRSTRAESCGCGSRLRTPTCSSWARS